MNRSTRPLHPTTLGMLQLISDENKNGSRPTGYKVTGYGGGVIPSQTRNGRYKILRRLEREGLIRDTGGSVSAWEVTIDGLAELHCDG